MRDIQSLGAGDILQSRSATDIILFAGSGGVDNTELAEDKVLQQVGPFEDEEVFVEFYELNDARKVPSKGIGWKSTLIMILTVIIYLNSNQSIHSLYSQISNLIFL
jgi:hypothetical protein